MPRGDGLLARSGDRHYAAVLTDAAVAQLRRRARLVSGTPEAHGFVSRAAVQYGVGQPAISKAVRGITFRHVMEAPVQLDRSATPPVVHRQTSNTRLSARLVARLRRAEAALLPAKRAAWRRAQAARYQVSLGTLADALRGRTWQHVAVPPAVLVRPTGPRWGPPPGSIRAQMRGVWLRVPARRGQPAVERFFPAGPRGGRRRALLAAQQARRALWRAALAQERSDRHRPTTPGATPRGRSGARRHGQR